MAQNAPVEGSTSFLNDIWNVFDEAVDTVSGSIWSAASAVADAWSGFIEGAADLVQSAKKGEFSFASPLLNDDERKRLQPKTAKIDDDDKDMSEKLNEYDGWTMAKGILSGGKKIVSEKIFGSTLTKNLVPEIDEKTFNQRLSSYQEEIANSDKNMNDIVSSDPKFKAFRDFNDSVKAEYLKARNVTTVADQADFDAFQIQALNALDPLERKRVLSQQSELGTITQTFQKDREEKEKKMKEFLNSSIRTTDGKTGEKLFEEYSKEGENFMKENAFLGITQRVREKTEEYARQELAKDPRAIIGAGSSYSELFEAMVDDMTERKTYYLTIKGMKDLEDADVMAEKFKESSDAFDRLNMEFVRKYGMTKNDPEFKGLSEVEKRNRIQNNVWNNLPDEDKALIQQAESVVTGISRRRELEQMKSRAGNLNPMALLDGLALGTSVFQSVVDKVYALSNDKGEVPHYVNQEMRNLLYSDEGNLKKAVSMITYNTDALVSMAGSMASVDKPLKYFNKGIDKVFEAGKGLVIPGIKIGFTTGKLSVIPAAVKGFTSSVITGAASDPIFDNLMVQAPNKASEEFNMLTNVLFDTTIFSLGKWVAWGGEGLSNASRATANGLMWKKMAGEEKGVVEAMQKHLETSFGKKMTLPETAKFMKDGEHVFRSMWNPADIDRIFTKKGELFTFLKTNFEGMDSSGIEEVLTANGLGIRRNKLLGLEDSAYDDIEKLTTLPVPTQKSSLIEKQRYELAKAAVNKRFDEVIAFAEGKGMNNQTNIRRELMRSEGYDKDKKALIKTVLDAKNEPEQEMKVQRLRELDDAVFAFQGKYAVRPVRQTVTLVDVAGTGHEITIALNDLKSLDGMQNKNLSDLISEGSVSVKQDKFGLKTDKQYRIKTNLEDLSNTMRNKFVNEIVIPRTNDFVADQVLKGFDFGVSKEEASLDIHQAVNKVLKWGAASFDFLEKYSVDVPSRKEGLNGMLAELSEFMTEQVREYVGKDFVGNPLFINRDVKDLNSQGLADAEKLINVFESKEKPFNLMIGYFSPNKADLKTITTKVYITAGKPIASEAAFKNSLDVSKSVKPMVDYANKLHVIMEKIMQYGFNPEKSMIDVTEGIRKAKIIESVGYGSDLFKAGKLVPEKIHEIVKEALGESDKAVADFTYKVFEGMDESQMALVRPMVYNFAMKYKENKPLISQLIARVDPKNKSSLDMVKAFSQIILAPALYDDVIAKMLPLTKDGIKKETNEFVEIEWRKYLNSLKSELTKVEINVAKLKDFVKNTKDPIAKLDFSAKLEIEKEKAKRLDTHINSSRTSNTFAKEKEKMMIDGLNLQNLKKLTENFSFSATLGKAPHVEATVEYVKAAVKFKNDLSSLAGNKEMIAEVGSFFTRVKESIVDLDKRLQLIDEVELEKDGIMKDAKRFLLNAVDDRTSQYVIVDTKAIEDIIKNNSDSVMEKSYADANNPIQRYVEAFANNSNSWQDRAFNEALILQYSQDPTVKNSDDLYNKSQEFRDLINGMFSKGDAEKIVYGNTEPLIAALRKALTDSDVQIEVSGVPGNYSVQLFEDMFKKESTRRAIVNKFKSLANREISDADVNIEKVGEYENLTLVGDKYNEKVLQLEAMKDSGMNVKFLRGMGGKDFSKLKFWRGKESTTLSKMFKSLFDKNYEEGNDVVKHGYISDAEIYKEIVKVLNGRPTEYSGIFTEARVAEIRKQLGMENGEFFMGNFGDKDTIYTYYRIPEGINLPSDKEQAGKIAEKVFELEYALKMNYVSKTPMSWNAVMNKLSQKSFSNYSEFKKFIDEEGISKSILSTKTIRKREASQMSNYSTFEGVKKDLTTLVIKKVTDIPDWFKEFMLPNGKVRNLSYEDLAKIKSLDNLNGSNRKLDEYLSELEDFYSALPEKEMLSKIKKFLDLYVANDLHDGTSFISGDLMRLRNKIQGMPSDTSAFKDHLFWDTEGGRVLAKTLFNWAEIMKDGKALSDTVVIGESSLKLDGWYEKLSETYEITIAGKKYEVIGKVKGVDTSFFKNAATESTKEDFMKTISDSIKARIGFEYAEKIEQIQLRKIDEAYDATIGSLTNEKITLSSYSGIEDQIFKAVSKAKVGYGTGTVVMNKIKEFLRLSKEIIEKPAEEGESMYLRESSNEITPEEVIMRSDSSMVKTLMKEQKDLISKIKGSDLSEEEKAAKIQKIKDKGLWVVGYRYPVPSEYNIGLYKVVLAEEKKGFEKIGKNQTVMNPLVSYLKIEGDNDGDHIFFLSARGEMGETLGKSVEWTIGIENNLVDNLPDDFRNKFIIADQVDKDAEDIVKTLPEEEISLVDSRAVALEAKQSISIVSATIRTVGTLKQMFQKYDSLSGVKKQEYGSQKIGETTMKELYQDYGDRINIDRTFSELVSSILQLTLDFGNSWLSKFDKSWYFDIMSKVVGEKDAISFYKKVVSPLSMGYNSFKFETNDFANMSKYKSQDLIKNVTGSKRNILSEMVSKYGEVIDSLRNSPELSIVAQMLKGITKSDSVSEEWRVAATATSNDIMKEINANGYVKDKVAFSAKIRSYLESYDSKVAAFADLIDTTMKDAQKVSKKEAEKKKKDLYESLKKKDFNPLSRLILSAYANAKGEYVLSNFLNEAESVKYMITADNKLKEKIRGLSGTEIIAKKIESGEINLKNIKEYQDVLTGELTDLNREIAELGENATEVTTNAIEVKEDMIREQLQAIDAYLNEKVEDQISVAETVQEEMVPIQQATYDLPEIGDMRVSVSPQAVNEMLSIHEDFASTARYGLKLTMQSLFNKYVPEFLSLYDNVRGLLNGRERAIAQANSFHVSEMGNRYFNGSKDSIRKQIKRAGVSTERADELVKKIERALLGNSNWTFKREDKESAIEEIKKAFVNTEAAALTDDPKFVERLLAYQENVIDVVAERLNYLQDYHKVDILSKYGKESNTIVTDTMEAHKGDAELALKIFGIQSETEFKAMVRDNAEAMGTKVSEATVNMMTKVTFKGPKTQIEKFFNFIQGVHYELSYGTMATFFTQNNIVAGLTQIIPNYVELRSMMRRNPESLAESFAIMRDYRFALSEDVLAFGTGLGMNLKENAFAQTMELMTKTMVEWGLKKFGVTPARAKRAGEIVDSAVNNMLGFNDWPLEQLRKLVAIQTVMAKMGIPDKKALDEYFAKGGKVVRDSFESKMIIEFANSGGWVVSSSAIARGTVFEHANLYFDNVVTQFMAKSLGYLMGWSFHKAANLIEKESALFTGTKLLFTGDTAGAKAHLDDFFRFNTMIANQLGYSVGLYLKFQKYERDNEDRVPLDKFLKSFNNSIVSLEILYRKHFNAWDSAQTLGADGVESTQYTAYSVIERMFRLFKQPQFLNTVYDRYRTQEILGKEDMVEAFQYGMEKHYSSFMRFQGILAMDDMYNTVNSKGNLGVLGTGGSTAEDEIYDELFSNNDFAKWRDKGSLMRFVSMFTGMMKTSDSSVGYAISTDLAKEIVSMIEKDAYLSRLKNGWQIGAGKGDYDLSRILGNKSVAMTEEQEAALAKIWAKMTYGSYQYLDDKGNRIKFDATAIDEGKMQDILEGRITKELAKKGISMEEVIKMDPSKTAGLLKTMAVLDLESNVKTPVFLYLIMSMKEKAIQKELKKSSDTKDISGYDVLSPKQNALIRKNILLQYQDYLNLDTGLVHEVIGEDVKMHHKDIMDKFAKIDNFKYIQDDVMRMLNTDYLVNNIIRTQKDATSVSKLQSRYALALRAVNMSTATGVDVALKFMNDVNELPFMDGKAKLAHQAAILYGLNKTQFGLLKDNKKFQELTEQSQKELTNWMYKVSSESLDYDSNSLAHQMNAAAGSRHSTKRYSPPFKSKGMSDKRPNFAEQFAPIRSYLPGKQQLISDNPREYLRAAGDFRPQSFGLNPARFPIVQEYAQLVIQSIFYGYKSKGIIPSYVVEPKFDKSQKKYINLKKAKKAQWKKNVSSKGFKPAPKVSGGAWAGLPLSNLQD